MEVPFFIYGTCVHIPRHVCEKLSSYESSPETGRNLNQGLPRSFFGFFEISAKSRARFSKIMHDREIELGARF